MIKFTLCFGLLCLLILPVVGRAAPPFTLIEAEADPHGTVQTDPAASGGKFVMSGGAYQPLLVTSLPATGDSFVVWVRYRGVAVQLKGVGADGKQTERNWLYASPGAWTWASFGRHARAELGAKALVMRGTDGTTSSGSNAPGVDALLFARDDAFDPNTAFPVAANVSVQWTQTVARTTPLSFGTNDFSAAFPKDGANDPAYARNLAGMGFGFYRIHQANLSNLWSDPQTGTWDAAKVRAAYDAPYLRGKTLLQNIPNWPDWMKHDGDFLDPSEYDHYAKFCADLVRLVNGKMGRKVRLWEPLNEKDVAYFKAGRFQDLCVIYNKAAAAMKAADPSIEVGGMAFTWDDPEKVEAFLKTSAPSIDFLTWHRYASGDKNDPTDKIMAYTAEYGKQVRLFRTLADKYSPHRRIALVLDEYNINYTWQSGETRQWSNVGATWFASVLKHLSEAGVDMAAQWNAKDGFYGLTDNADVPRPAATVYTWANAYFVGAVCPVQSGLPTLEAFAVRQKDESRSLLLINTAAGAATVTLTGPPPASVQRLDTQGVFAPASGPVTLPPYSVVLLRWPHS